MVNSMMGVVLKSSLDDGEKYSLVSPTFPNTQLTRLAVKIVRDKTIKHSNVLRRWGMISSEALTARCFKESYGGDVSGTKRHWTLTCAACCSNSLSTQQRVLHPL